MRDIGKNIRSLRQRQGMSQDQLAQTLHVTRQTISNYETGRSRPDVEILTSLADALGADVKEVLYGPVGQEARKKQLRHLAIGVVLAVLVGVLYRLGSSWALELQATAYLLGPALLLQILLKPLLYGLLTWILIRICMIATRSTPPTASWAAWIRWGAVAILSVYVLAMLPLTISLIQWTWTVLDHLANQAPYNSTGTELLMNPIAAWILRRPGHLLCMGIIPGAIWGTLGFPSYRAPKQADAEPTEKNDSPA